VAVYGDGEMSAEQEHSECALAAYGQSSARSLTNLLPISARQDRAPTVRWGPKGLRSTTGP